MNLRGLGDAPLGWLRSLAVVKSVAASETSSVEIQRALTTRFSAAKSGSSDSGGVSLI